MISYDQMTLLFALLGVLVQVAVVAILVDRLLGSKAGSRWGIVEAVAPWGLWLAFAVALTATAGSLYLSEVAHLPPCRLCWYQRAAVYPLVPILGVAAWRHALGVAPVVWVFNGVGSAVSLWHVFIERFPTLDAGGCDPSNPCSVVWFRHFGYLTVPALALVAQVGIAAFVWCARTGRPDPASVSPDLEVTPA